MIPVGQLFLNEGIIGRFVNSISNIFRGRSLTQKLPVRQDTVEKIEQGGEAAKRLVPRPSSPGVSDKQLGFKPPRILRMPK